MKGRVFATPEAEQQILEVSAWWHAKRPAAEGQFDRELSDTLNLLGEAPDLGRRYRRARIPGLRPYLRQHPELHAALERATGSVHRYEAAGRARWHYGFDERTRHHYKIRRLAVEADASRTGQIVP